MAWFWPSPHPEFPVPKKRLLSTHRWAPYFSGVKLETRELPCRSTHFGRPTPTFLAVTLQKPLTVHSSPSPQELTLNQFCTRWLNLINLKQSFTFIHIKLYLVLTHVSMSRDRFCIMNLSSSYYYWLCTICNLLSMLAASFSNLSPQQKCWKGNDPVWSL